MRHWSFVLYIIIRRFYISFDKVDYLTLNFFFFAQTNLLVILNTSVQKFLDLVESSIFCARRILENSIKTPLHVLFHDRSLRRRSSDYLMWVYLCSCISHVLTFEKCAETLQKCYRLLQQYPRLKKGILYKLLDIGQCGTIKTPNDGRTETSELSLWEPWKDSQWNLFPSLSNVIFRVFCLKPTSNFEKCYRKHISSNPAVFTT